MRELHLHAVDTPAAGPTPSRTRPDDRPPSAAANRPRGRWTWSALDAAHVSRRGMPTTLPVSTTGRTRRGVTQ